MKKTLAKIWLGIAVVSFFALITVGLYATDGWATVAAFWGMLGFVSLTVTATIVLTD